MSRARSNQPPVSVECAANGQPRALRWQGRTWRIEAVLNRWRVETGLWDTPIQCDYYKVALDSGGMLLLVHDQTAGDWFVRRIYA